MHEILMGISMMPDEKVEVIEIKDFITCPGCLTYNKCTLDQKCHGNRSYFVADEVYEKILERTADE